MEPCKQLWVVVCWYFKVHLNVCTKFEWCILRKYTQSGANYPNIFSQFLLHSTTISYKYHVDSTLLGVGSSVHKHSQRNSISIYTLSLYHNILSPYTSIQIDDDLCILIQWGGLSSIEVSLRLLVTLPGKRLRFSA